jgi:uncharacterized repeat protein (TIGR01451 family)
MRIPARNFLTLLIAALLCGYLGIITVHLARAQGTDVNVSQLAEYENECSIISNPSNALQLFAACNHAGPGIFAARSTDGGATWTYPDPADRTIADGDAGQGAAACCDPTLAWDTFGNLYLGYIDSAIANIVILISTDGGATFNPLATFAGSVDQPTIVAANTTDPAAPVALWAVWNQSGAMVARGAAVTGLGTVGAFNALQNIPGTAGCSFGDIAIAPTGVVVQACQNPTGGEGPASILVNTDPDGLGPANFGAAVIATTTNVGGFDFIPAQNVRSVDAEAGLAYDSNPTSPHFGRLYLVYTDEPVDENNDTDIMLRFSDNDGAGWNAPLRVNADPAIPIRSQFLPRIATSAQSGNVAVCWHDARNSPTNDTMQEFCTVATPAGAAPTFLAEVQMGDAASTGAGSSPPASGELDIQFGDYSGMTFVGGAVHPIWADNSNSTGDNPDGTTTYDAYADRVAGGISISKTRIDPPAGAIEQGGLVTFRIEITNNGIQDITNLPLDDIFDPSFLAFDSATVEPDAVVGGLVEWDNLTGLAPHGFNANLAPGATFTVDVTFRAVGCPPEQTTTDKAVVSGALLADGSSLPKVSATATVDIACPAVTVTKELAPPVVCGVAGVGDPVTFNITIANTGNATIDVLPLEDTYDTGFLSYTGAAPSSDDNLDDGTINWSDLTAAGPNGFGMDLAPGASFSVDVNFTAAASTSLVFPPETVDTATVSAAADAAGFVAPAASGAAAVQIANADLFVTKIGAAQVVAGTEIHYVITYGNNGPDDATHVRLRDLLPAGGTYLADTLGGIVVPAPGQVDWFLGTVLAGSSNTFQLTVRTSGATTPGTVVTNGIAIESGFIPAGALCGTPDSDLTNNFDSVDTTILSGAPSHPDDDDDNDNGYHSDYDKGYKHAKSADRNHYYHSTNRD